MHPNQKIAELMNQTESRMIIGIKGPAFNRDIPRIIEVWPNIQMRYRENHAKMVILQRNKTLKGYAGSCNFNDSTMGDIMVKMSAADARKALEQFEVWWATSKEIKVK